MEIWKDITGYGGRYKVSNYGNVLSLQYKTPRILKHGIMKNGYHVVTLSIYGVSKKCLVHRLVAIEFIPNPYKLSEVDHIDTNKNNNKVSNLKWSNHKDNSNNPITLTHYNKDKERKIVQLNLDGSLVRIWDSMRQAERDGGFRNSHISKCCMGCKRYKTHKGYKWMYYEDYKDNTEVNK